MDSFGEEGKLLEPRIIPCLLVSHGQLVKTEKFMNPAYVGNVLNAVNIFNSLNADEVIVLNIDAAGGAVDLDFELINMISEQCTSPLGYGGGITSMEQAERVFSCGCEKIILNTAAFKNPQLIRNLSDRYGRQAIVVSLDIAVGRSKEYELRVSGGREKVNMPPIEFAPLIAGMGAGELMVTSIDREGTMDGYDLDLIKSIVEIVDVPVIAHGGAGSVIDFANAFVLAGASASAAGANLVYRDKGKAVVIHLPSKDEIEEAIQELKCGNA